MRESQPTGSQALLELQQEADALYKGMIVIQAASYCAEPCRSLKAHGPIYNRQGQVVMASSDFLSIISFIFNSTLLLVCGELDRPAHRYVQVA